jgi:hypothetical protein
MNPYRIPYALRDELKNQIDETVRRGVLTKAATEWAAPVILMRKKSTDRTLKYRFCADFRGLNAVTKITSILYAPRPRKPGSVKREPIFFIRGPQGSLLSYRDKAGG